MAKFTSLSTGKSYEYSDGQWGGGNVDALLQPYIQGALASPGTISGGRYITQAEGLKKLLEEEQTDEEKIKDSLVSRLEQLEQLWYGNEDILALDKPGNQVDRNIHRANVWYKAPSEYVAFSSFAKTLGASLAKAGGDTGNIAWAEQQAQLNALANVTFTKEEGEAAFRRIRAALDVEDKGREDFVKTTKKAKKKGDEIIPGLTMGDVEVEDKDDKEDGGTRYASMLGQLLGSGFAKNPAYAALLGGGGEAIQQISEKGIPTSKEEAEAYTGTQDPLLAAGLVGPLGTLFGSGESASKDVLQAGSIASLLNMLLHPFRTLGGFRSDLAARSGKTIAGSKLVEAGEKYASKQTAGHKTLQNLIGRDVERFAGKDVPLEEVIAETSRRAQKGYKLSGAPSRAVTGGYLQSTERAMRDLIGQADTPSYLLTQAMRPFYLAKNVGNLALRKLLGPALQYLAISKGVGALGQQ